ncbi:MAG: tRNA (adenosine(37)-N6)-threonylcarbamoyltransferase complex dimerization subunit type 1 TsaB [Hydrogenophaga sp.]|uniref:tRNA (adenosine(37)-N6)-threonylcarbamoyltransferase complex dimerization subunit type 1 TsaB n=1 Tax=Hydrogenophaga sp. TaxID=1904254 RepID=UPI001DE6E883|nr:tRNA (adenosine(37)-N6)-threonylcarbamoyltransferase complex dimerization subunit type 1 TsaB [Hydrogenophaga sp.]MBX3609468.1 tRNA (adenosine(37)-N6)-threonylcarbamoyltransferase complex dimerization subunit type 1 TsaB [Hydrogenophaga sp.]
MTPEPRLLAIDSSTDTLSLALAEGTRAVQHHTGPGGAQASHSLLPQAQALLDAAGWGLSDLDAIVFGRGPGSFTGLRTACAVAQGLAYGTRSARHPEGLPVLPVDTLLALAEQARADHAAEGSVLPRHIVALLDARMDELYLAVYACGPQGVLSETVSPRLIAPADLAPWLLSQGLGEHTLLAGNAFAPYADALAAAPGQRRNALPTAQALLRLAPAMLANGMAVAAREALPLYVRDKVARTTAEREGRPAKPQQQPEPTP